MMMTHPHLNTLNQNQLDYQIGSSKQCLASHGYNSTIFAYPYNIGSNDPTVLNTVAKYYNIGRSGTAPLMFLNCIGFKKNPQNDCRTYEPNGELNRANRYVARSLSFDIVELKDSFINTNMFSDFVKIVNSQSTYNQGGKINAVPLIIFHSVDLSTNEPYSTNAGFFDQLMKYLYENHFKVLTYKELGYNTQTNTFYLNGVSSQSPDPNDKLLKLGNFILTPHIAGWTIESVDTTARIIATNIERFAQAEIPLTIVNPELTY